MNLVTFMIFRKIDLKDKKPFLVLSENYPINPNTFENLEKVAEVLYKIKHNELDAEELLITTPAFRAILMSDCNEPIRALMVNEYDKLLSYLDRLKYLSGALEN